MLARSLIVRAAAFVLTAFSVAYAYAEEAQATLTIEGHKFTPAEVRVPANQRVKLLVTNKDDTPEEFESQELRVEKVIAAGGRATVFVGPLKPGRYSFVGEYHESTARGVLIAE
jgi:hypothetical protein